MTTDLREELTALAETQTFSPDPTAWDRGRRGRRRTRVVRAGAVLAVVALVVGVGAIAVQPDREVPMPAGDVRGGALPSRVPEPDGPVLIDLAIGSASVAYVDTNGMPVLVGATTGEAHHVSLPDFPGPEVFELTADFRRGALLALSPDGRHLAYPTTSAEEREPGEFSFITSWYRVVDLTTGESDLVDLPPIGGTPLAVSWTTDGRIAVDVHDKVRPGKRVPDVISWTIDPGTGGASSKPLIGVTAPGGGISAPYPELDAVGTVLPFETADDRDPLLDLPSDLYPVGALVQPLGWVESDVLVASVDPPQSDSVERPRLAIITSPDRPEAERIFREFLPRLPPSESLSIAVDLIPDLTGDPDQELTHDFSTAQMGDSEGGRAWYVAGGVIVLMAGIVWLLRRVPT